MNDVFDKTDLALGYAAGRPVKHGHHDRQIPILLLVCLGKVLLRYSAGPLDAEFERPCRIAHVGTLDQHPSDKNLVVIVVVRCILAIDVRTEHADEFGQMFKVAGHLRCQDHVDDDRPGQLVRFSVQVFEDVDFVVRCKR